MLAILSANQSTITSGALTTAATVGANLTETLLVLFTLVFFLQGGSGVWQFLLGLVPDDVRTRVNVAGRRRTAALVVTSGPPRSSLSTTRSPSGSR